MKHCAVVLPAMLALLPLLSCSARDTASFRHEHEAVERAMPREARLLSTAKSHHSTGAVEASWQYEIPGDPNRARNLLRTAFKSDYQLVHEDATSLSFAKFDGTDSFHLNMSLESHGAGSTFVHVILTAMPG